MKQDLKLNNIKQDLYNYMENRINALDCDQQLKKSIYYSLINNGKLFRPLIFLSYLDNNPQYFDIAMSIECIHTYSLVHDDLPCMDDDDYRRGQLTVHKKFGEDIALLTGDSLLTLSFELIASSAVADSVKVKLIKILSICSGVNHGMINGQMLDMTNQNQSVSQLVSLEAQKTGSLLVASLLMANAINNKNNQQQLIDLGYYLGIYYQMYDDYLDCYSNFETIGKPIGSDLENDKQTFATLYAKDELEQHLSTLSSYIIAQINQLNLTVSCKSILLSIIDWSNNETI